MYFDIFQSSIKIACICATIALIGMWIVTYNLDKDSSVIESKNYFETDDDHFPVMSLCFNQFYDDLIFKDYGENVTAKAYQQFLFGNHFDENLTKIDFHRITTNISNYLIEYDVMYRNGTEIFTKDNLSWKPLYHTFSWFSWGYFLKCFGFELLEKNIYYVRIVLSRKIFENNVNKYAGSFAVLFHYPNQVMSSIQTLKREWLVWDNETNHYITFNIKGMETSTLRYKQGKDNCVPDWKEYDNVTLEDHLRTVGCKRPDQITDSDLPICTSKEKMKQANIPLSNDKIKPCRRVESVDFDLGESLFDGDLGYGNCWFCIVLRILNPQFKDTIQVKAVDIEMLVGYIGGYVGILTGFSLIQIPLLTMTIARQIDKILIYFKCIEKSKVLVE